MDDEAVSLLKSIDLGRLCLREGLGSLKFENSYKLLGEIQKRLQEIIAWYPQANLGKSDVQKIDRNAKEFAALVKKIDTFSLNDPNPKETWQRIENQVSEFQDRFYQELRPLVQQIEFENFKRGLDTSDVRQLEAEAVEAKRRYQELSDGLSQKFATVISDLESKLKLLEDKAQDVKKGAGLLANAILAKRFSEQVKTYSDDSKIWLKFGVGFFGAVFLVVVFNIVIFFRNWIDLTDPVFATRYLILKLSLITLFSFAGSYCLKKYKIYSHLTAANEHRRNVAQTLEYLLESATDQKVIDALLREGAKAMFAHLPIGYLKHEVQRDEHPVAELINVFQSGTKPE